MALIESFTILHLTDLPAFVSHVFRAVSVYIVYRREREAVGERLVAAVPQTLAIVRQPVGVDDEPLCNSDGTHGIGATHDRAGRRETGGERE